MNKRILALALLLAMGTGLSAQVTEKPGFGKYALVGATIHTVTDGTIENGTVLVNGETIEFVGANGQVPAGYQRLDLTGKHIWPGMIDAGTVLGLMEVDAVPVTVDSDELGDFNPHMRAFTAINPAAVAIPVNRVEGVTTVISQPGSGIISGMATLIDLFGYSPDSMAVVADAALVLQFPTKGRRFGGFFFFGPPQTEEQIEEAYRNRIKSLNEYIAKARFYDGMMDAYEAAPAGKRRPDRDPAMEAMRPVVDGTIPVMIQVDREPDIIAALDWIKTQEGLRFILSGVSEGWRVADRIAAAGVPVVTGPVIGMPTRDYDVYSRPYENAGLMAKAGVMVALRTDDSENVRNLPFNAGMAVANGMTHADALKAVTINPATMFGAADRLGSVSVGKQANLVVTNGDLFETMTQVEHVFIRGRKIPLVSRHEELWREYRDRDATTN